MSNNIKTAERKAFEAWYEADSMPLESDWFRLDDDGDYFLSATSHAWNAWQACVVLAAKPQPDQPTAQQSKEEL